MLHVITHLLTLCCAHSINTHQNSRHSTLGLKLLKDEGHTRGTFFKEESKVTGYILVYIYTLAWITVENTGSLTVLELSCLCHTLKRCLVHLSEICEWQKGGRKNAPHNSPTIYSSYRFKSKESPGNERAKNIKEAINQPLLLNKC